MSKLKSNKMGVVQLTILTMVNMMGPGSSCYRPNCLKSARYYLGCHRRRLDGAGPRLRNAVCFLAVNPAVWAVTPNMPSVNPATLWRIIPLRRLAADRQRGYRHLLLVGYGNRKCLAPR